VKFATNYTTSQCGHLVCIDAPEIFGKPGFHNALLLGSRRRSIQKNCQCTLAASEALCWAINKRWSEITQELLKRDWHWSFRRFGSFGHYGMVVTRWRDRYWEAMGQSGELTNKLQCDASSKTASSRPENGVKTTASCFSEPPQDGNQLKRRIRAPS
jgi:hypothetical protein